MLIVSQELKKDASEYVEKKTLDLAAIEERMNQCEQLDIPLEHIFSEGIYVRKITIPAGALIMGKRHRRETCNMLIKGKLAIFVNENEPPVIIESPMIFTTPPGTKKFAYCLEEAVFVNVLPTDLKDPEEIERQWIIPEQEYLQSKEAPKCLSSHQLSE